MVRILGLDPGTNNFAYSVLSSDEELDENGLLIYRIEKRGLILSTVRDLRSGAMRKQMATFHEAISEILAGNTLDLWIGERYMIRRGQGGSAIESINLMLGSLVALLDVPCRVMPASEWKNTVNKIAPLEETYEALSAGGAQLKTDPDRITVHEVDAAHIAAFGIGKALSAPPNYSILRQLNGCAPTHLGLTNRIVKKKKVKRKPK
jgi:hypothetical protein